MTNNDTEQDQSIEIINLDKQKGNSWKRARYLESKKTAEYTTMEMAYNLTGKFNNLRDRCLYAILYLCGARIEEVVRYKSVKYGKKKAYVIKNGIGKNRIVQDYSKKRIGKLELSIKREDITLEEHNGRQILIIRIRNLKNKNPKEKVKLIPIPLDNPIYERFVKVINTYISAFNDDEELFPICKRRAEKIMERIGFNPHYIRHIRLTHLVRYHNFTDQKLIKYAGWTDSRPAKSYVSLNWKDLANSM